MNWTTVYFAVVHATRFHSPFPRHSATKVLCVTMATTSAVRMVQQCDVSVCWREPDLLFNVFTVRSEEVWAPLQLAAETALRNSQWGSERKPNSSPVTRSRSLNLVYHQCGTARTKCNHNNETPPPLCSSFCRTEQTTRVSWLTPVYLSFSLISTPFYFSCKKVM